MAWPVSLYHPGTLTSVEVPNHYNGDVAFTGGSCTADLEVSYNLVEFFPFLDLNKKTARETRQMLWDAVVQLGTKQSKEPWRALPGNTGAVCAVLLAWADLHPDGVWHVD